jgi:hypothetical protein
VTLSYVNADYCTPGGTGCNGVKLGESASTAPIGGSVTINSSTFNGNNNNGLLVYAKGVLKLSSVVSNGNTRYGVYLDNSISTAVTPPGVTINGSSFTANQFNFNTSSGLVAYSKGAISISHATANFNGASGIDLGESLVNNGGSNVTMKYITTRNNTLTGIYVDSRGKFTGSYITSIFNSNGNTWNGIYLVKHNSNVTISNSIFMGNDLAGIYVIFEPGRTATFTKTNVTVIGNKLFQIWVVN